MSTGHKFLDNRICNRFSKDRKGSVAIIFGLVFPVIVLATGMAIDFSRANNVKAVMANAIDAAALAAAKHMADGESADDATALAREYFEANLAGFDINGVSVTNFALTRDEEAGSVDISADATLPTSFMQLAGYDVLTVGVDTTAIYKTRPVEMALMLDTTGSMSGSKIEDLRNAAEEVVDMLLPEGRSTDGKVKISLVPYSSAVNAGDYTEAVTGESTGNLCVTERGGRNAFTDRSPERRRVLKQATDRCPDISVEPLTESRDALLDKIRDLPAAGSTAGHLGISWAWYTLSPSWSSVWPAESTPVNYGEDGTVKVAVLMTDGKFNTEYIRRNGDSSQQAEETCENMKEDGVVVYAVAFRAPASAERLLSECSTDADTHYFDAESGADLIAAFRTIAAGVQDLRLTR